MHSVPKRYNDFRDREYERYRLSGTYVFLTYLKYASRDNSAQYLSANFLTSNMMRNGTRIDFIWAELSLDAYFRKIATR